jgi:Lysine methyltransferase
MSPKTCLSKTDVVSGERRSAMNQPAENDGGLEPFLWLLRHGTDKKLEVDNVSERAQPPRTLPIYFQEDWAQGIGGGLWSTGLALSKYFGASMHARRNLVKLLHEINEKQISNSMPRPRKLKGISALELGSGNGLLAICLACCSVALPGSRSPLIEEIVITDTCEHLPLIRKTVQSNQHVVQLVNQNDNEMNESELPESCKVDKSRVSVSVVQYNWGYPFTQAATLEREVRRIGPGNDCQTDSQETEPSRKFDLIIGSDLAYHKALYQPLIKTLQYCSHDESVILLGVTMNDTTPDFFVQLQQAGFQYQRFSDDLFEDSTFRGRTFGIFYIRKAR